MKCPFHFAMCLVFTVLLHAGIPAVQRTLSHSEVAPCSTIIVTIQVTLPESDNELYKAWILQEAWPSGCEVQGAFWNGISYPPVQRENDVCWIFGYPDTSWEVENGTLSYELVLPALQEGQTRKPIAVEGIVYTAENEEIVEGDSDITLDMNAPFVESLPLKISIAPGWNLLSLPCTLSKEEQERFLPGGNFYCCNEDASPKTMAFYQCACPETPGTPFWFHDDSDSTRVVSLSATDPVADAVTPNGGVWHEGWNLVGISGSATQQIESEREIWIWQNGTYCKNPQNTLAPGQTAWIWR